jgi:hypothetical protein
MNLTRVTLENAATVLILENVLTQDLLEQAHALCESFSEENPDWVPFTPERLDRYSYQGNHPIFNALKEYFGSKELIDQLNTAVTGERLELSMFKIWVDLPKFGPLVPHVESSDAYIAQIFVTHKEHSYTGTTIYNNDKEILFQLPYRNNCGWFFNNGSNVMHGREHGVPWGIQRFVLMIWYGNAIPGDDLSKISF